MQILNYIDGEFQEPKEGRYFPSFNPATKQENVSIPDSGAADVELAVKAASRAFNSWSLTTPKYRFLFCE